jgi:hypothetical protein
MDLFVTLNVATFKNILYRVSQLRLSSLISQPRLSSLISQPTDFYEI